MKIYVQQNFHQLGLKLEVWSGDMFRNIFREK